LAVERQGEAFFGKAKRFAANPRVKAIFKDLEQAKATHVGIVEALVEPGAEAEAPPIFDLDQFHVVECYVCGHAVESDRLPKECPTCGAPNYAFEVDISETAAYELSAAVEASALKLFKELAMQVDAVHRERFQEFLRREEALLDELRAERQRLAAQGA
jgi:rubrerythrin